jgi:hypothetical protein
MIAQRIRSATGLPIAICDIAEKYIFHERAYEHINIFFRNVFENKVCSLCYEKFDSNRHRKHFCAFCDREPVCWSCMGDYCDAQKCMLFACVDCTNKHIRVNGKNCCTNCRMIARKIFPRIKRCDKNIIYQITTNYNSLRHSGKKIKFAEYLDDCAKQIV